MTTDAPESAETTAGPHLPKRLSIASRFLASVGIAIFAYIVGVVSMAIAFHGQDLGLAGLAFLFLITVGAGIAFVITFISLGTLHDARDARKTILFIAGLVIVAPLVLSGLNWIDSHHYDTQQQKSDTAKSMADCARIRVYFNWSQCVKKTIATDLSLEMCHAQGRKIKNPEGKTLEGVCDTYLAEYQQNTQMTQAVQGVTDLTGCTAFATSTDISTWKFCIDKVSVNSRADYDECYRQARLQPIPPTGYWPMGQFCGSHYKESFGH